MDKFYIATEMQNVGKLVAFKGPMRITIDVANATDPSAIVVSETIDPVLVSNIQPILDTDKAMVEFQRIKSE